MRYCRECGNELKEGAKICTKCGTTLIPPPLQQTQPQYYEPQYYAPQPIKHTGFGIAGLVLGIIAVVMSGIIILYFIGIILGIIAIVFGAIAYWGKSRDKYGLAGFICGLVAVILAIIWIIIFVILVYRTTYI